MAIDHNREDFDCQLLPLKATIACRSDTTLCPYGVNRIGEAQRSGPSLCASRRHRASFVTSTQPSALSILFETHSYVGLCGVSSSAAPHRHGTVLPLFCFSSESSQETFSS
ncbi:hypothetical protein GMOD_00001501 [Pyrenophora seminiperda CCB06]|uniref:Uncharacterized protein n=1 Tax=Pyrenophora seminiperda CCB06 TaxID=1302712 RepID=A0A3M7LZG2_9PLEO|nr:hypothetical protein GMOD_00001501 [Pyrenophora seminiperda CCB06]